MTGKRIFGIVVLIGGIVLLITSFYIKSRTEEGKTKISEAQKEVNQGKGLFSFNPAAKEIGQEAITRPAQKKINEANQEVAQYETLAKWSLIAGIVLFILGIGIIIIGRKKISR